MAENPLKLKKIHHIEFWVGNARQASYFYRKGFGFSQIAYRGLETGERQLTSYVLSQGRDQFRVHHSARQTIPPRSTICKHGDGVRDMALHVEDADQRFRGGRPPWRASLLRSRTTNSDTHGAIRRAAVHTYGDTIHSLISYKDYSGPFLPGFAAASNPGDDAGILRIDHVVGNVELGRMEQWADYYSRVFGFQRYITFDDKDISTEYSALMSIVMSDDSHSVKFPINEPAPGRKKSQIDEYLDAYGGPASSTSLCSAMTRCALSANCKKTESNFCACRTATTRRCKGRVGNIDESIEAIRSLGILVDRDQEGYLLQIFSRPVEDRPTLFFEIIQRKGSRGFGKGNFKALFESIELEQARRGNL